MTSFPMLSASRLRCRLLGALVALLAAARRRLGLGAARRAARSRATLALFAQFRGGRRRAISSPRHHAAGCRRLGVNYTLGVDGINLFLLSLNALLTLVARRRLVASRA